MRKLQHNTTTIGTIDSKAEEKKKKKKSKICIQPKAIPAKKKKCTAFPATVYRYAGSIPIPNPRALLKHTKKPQHAFDTNPAQPSPALLPTITIPIPTPK
ncbi:predicted protein [Plenodomus lingam JN3]|uniref:Predicted protein n=1 Tax=Leptosphaeria maculans (strain JN3 / isolate v23.1.3 / race Av1-4-5-6-7-8) TaxID=985895 RepID=E5A1E7_LEPMJ|nr:predicted protein [Plenodomus lingam JN3]CBX97411.1 predicted protein [Plenodomus lingam JN3]